MQTFEGIDRAGLQLTVKTDLGIALSLPVTNAEVVKGLSRGDQVKVELDEQGRVMKVVKAGQDSADILEIERTITNQAAERDA